MVRFSAAATLAAAFLLGSSTARAAGTAETAVVQEILDGKELYIDEKPARVRERAAAPDVVRTRNSRGQLAFGGGAAGRLNRFSQLRLGSSCFLMQKGQILVSGRQNGCTRSARLSVRGTNYVIDVQDDGSSEVSVLEGSVEVEPLQDGSPTGAPVTTVEAGQRLRLSPTGVILALLQLSAADYSSVLNGPLFSGFTSTLPGYAALESHIRSALPTVTLPPPPSLPVTPVLPRIPGFRLF